LAAKLGRSPSVCETDEAIMMRRLERDELDLFWTIDRREVIRNIYVLRDGELVLTPKYVDVPGWAPGQREQGAEHISDCFERGGSAFGIFDGKELVGAALTDSILRGESRDRIQLARLHVSRDYRRRGIGVELFDAARADARERGARYLYVSAAPTENTVNFYLHRGCRLAVPPDPDLLALEPEDIHLVCEV
jgi:predicted N-acetyltransferase YhbS